MLQTMIVSRFFKALQVGIEFMLSHIHGRFSHIAELQQILGDKVNSLQETLQAWAHCG